MRITFLEAPNRLTKRFTRTADRIEKTAYLHAARFTSHTKNVSGIAALADLMRTHAAAGHCMLKGNTSKHLVKEARKGSTTPTEPTDWICLDIDGLPPRITIESFLSAIGAADISYVVQFSASYGIESKQLRAHVFMELAQPAPPAALKQWLIARNLEVPLLSRNLRLTSTKHALSYGLDITTCQNDKLIYIAPPELVGIPDPLAADARIAFVAKRHAVLSIDLARIPTAEANRIGTSNAVNRLRRKEGLPERAFSFDTSGDTQILVGADPVKITEQKTERGYTYFNLNGGDSWGYFHKEKHPDLIHNFKGEPVYRTAELLPEYWSRHHPNQTPPAPPAPDASSGVKYLAFLDKMTSQYWRGTFNPATNKLNIYKAANENQVKAFMKAHGLPRGDFTPEWDLIWDPTSTVVYDEATRTVNTFAPSRYMETTPTPRAAPPPTILKVLHNALGSDEALTLRFVNWLAFILQFREPAQTAWVLHGTTGTGKGLMVNKILKPIFGEGNITPLTQHLLDKDFNSYMNTSLLIFVDEMEHSALKNSASVMAKLKNYISEPTVQVRKMYLEAGERKNRTSWIFATNRPDPIHLDREDRRMNIARYQPHRLEISDTEIKMIEGELQHFHDYLFFHKVNRRDVRTPVRTEDQDALMSISETSIDSVVTALQTGDFEFLIDQLPTDERYKENPVDFLKVEAYQTVLKTLIERSDADKGSCNIARDELRTIFDFTCGNAPATPHKFAIMLRHHRMVIAPIRIADKTPRGIRVTWRDPALVKDAVTQFTKAPVKHLKVVK